MIPLRDTIPSQNPPRMTRTLIAANVVAFVFELLMSRQSLEQFTYLFGIVPARFTHPNWAAEVGFPAMSYLPFFTHMFLHAGWLHVIANMWTLWIFGDNVEDRMGPGRFLVFYILCGLAAAFTHVLLNADSTVPTVGASGAIAGVLAAYFLWFTHSRVLVIIPIFFFPLFAEIPAFLYLGIWFVTQLFSGTTALALPTRGGGIAFWAHIGGFIAGGFLCWLFLRPRDKRAPIESESDEFDTSWAPRWRRM